MWHQIQLTIPPVRRGFHLITDRIIESLPQLADVRIGQLHLFIQHTSASLTINECADPDVRRDLETAMNHVAPDSLPFVHTCEGPDDMPAHVKVSLLGNSLLIPVTNGRLALGTWQGIFLCEHRNRGTSRSIVVTLQGN